MVEGYVLDINQRRSVSQWIEGAPQKSLLSGLKIAGRANVNIQTWRCGRCGFLESYAKA